jgi:predicted nucleic acid-binding protein
VIIVIDTGVLGHLVHSKRDVSSDAWARLARLRARLGDEIELTLPEIADYELRRELLRLGSRSSLARLDFLPGRLRYVPITTAIMRRAAELWAETRRSGRPGAAPDALDGDLILVAQAESVGGRVLTTNVRHFDELVEVIDWTAC